MIYHLAPVKVSTNTNVAAIRNITVSPAAAELVERNGGEVDPSFVGSIAADPRIMFTSLDLAALLGAFSTNHYLAVDSSHTLEAFLYAVQDLGTRKTGSTHKKAVVNEGLLVPRDVTVDQDGLASMECECVASYDGTNEPIAVTNNVALPTAAMIEPFSLGPMKISNTTAAGIRRLTVSHGWNLQSYRDSGGKYPTTLYGSTRQPRVTVNGINANVLETYGLMGAALNTTAVFYLRKAKFGGGYYADNETEHISCTVRGSILPGGPTGGQDGALENDLTFLPAMVGANPCLTWAVGVAIPA